MVTVSGRVTFCSAKSLEIEVQVDVEEIMKSSYTQRHHAVDALFTFVSLDTQGKTLTIPPIKVCIYALTVVQFSTKKFSHQNPFIKTHE